MIGVTILGNNSAVPAFGRHPTSQIVTIANELIMIDCGEGTQMQLQQNKIRRSKIDVILISHLHGDHYFGLIGLLTSLGLMGRTVPLRLFAPPQLQTIIQLQLDVANVVLPYTIQFTSLEKEGIIYEHTKFTIKCFFTNHRITCFGFSISEKKNPRKLLPNKAIEYEIPAVYYNTLQQGEHYTNKKGEVIQNEWVTTAALAPKSYAYCADTKYDESLLPYITNVDLMYHETTYLNNLQAKATERFHSTSADAATIALKASAKRLLIGHFSSKYENDQLIHFQQEAAVIFNNVQLALEGCTYFV